MIAFACVSSDERRFRAGAARAIESVAETDSLLMRRHVPGSGPRPYAELLAEAARHDDLEALALLDQSVSWVGGELLAELRRLLATGSDVALIGAASVAGAREVESVGGPLLALSPWATRELHCETSVSDALEALAIDLSYQARARGRRVLASGALEVACADGSDLTPAERRARLRSTVAARRKWAPMSSDVSRVGR